MCLSEGSPWKVQGLPSEKLPTESKHASRVARGELDASGGEKFRESDKILDEYAGGIIIRKNCRNYIAACFCTCNYGEAVAHLNITFCESQMKRLYSFGNGTNTCYSFSKLLIIVRQ